MRRLVFLGLMLIVITLTTETTLYAMDAGYRYQYEVRYLPRLSDWLLWNQGWVFPVVILSLTMMTGWQGVALWQLVRRRRYLLRNAPILDDTPPPDHPYTTILLGLRATYLGRRAGRLPNGLAETRHDFRTEAWTTLVTLSEIDGSPGVAATFSTVLARRPLETILYAPGMHPPHDDVNTRWLRAFVLRGDDLEQTYLRHMEAVEAAYVDDGEPLHLPQHHTAALAWHKQQTKPATRYKFLVILGRALRALLTSLLLIVLMVYAWRTSFLLDTPPPFGSTLTEDEWPRLVQDVRVYLWGIALYFIVNLHPVAYYPPFRWTSTGLLLGAMGVLAFRMRLGLDGHAAVFSGLLVIAIIIGLSARAWRSFDRRRAWRTVQVQSTQAAWGQRWMPWRLVGKGS